MKYLLVHEDASLSAVAEFSNNERQAVDEGILDVIRFENGRIERLCVGGKEEADDMWEEV